MTKPTMFPLHSCDMKIERYYIWCPDRACCERADTRGLQPIPPVTIQELANMSDVSAVYHREQCYLLWSRGYVHRTVGYVLGWPVHDVATAVVMIEMGWTPPLDMEAV